MLEVGKAFSSGLTAAPASDKQNIKSQKKGNIKTSGAKLWTFDKITPERSLKLGGLRRD